MTASIWFYLFIFLYLVGALLFLMFHTMREKDNVGYGSPVFIFIIVALWFVCTIILIIVHFKYLVTILKNDIREWRNYG